MQRATVHRCFRRAPLQQYRQLSTTPSPQPSRLRRGAALASFIAAGTVFAYYYSDSRSSLHRYVLTPALRRICDPETGHQIAVRVLRSGWSPHDVVPDHPSLKAFIWGEELSNPVGLAAGFDKNGEAIDGLFGLGFGWVEVGSVTPLPQQGNPLPRFFRLDEDSAVINRYGFPSHGAAAVVSSLRSRFTHRSGLPELYGVPADQRASLRRESFLAINLGKNKASAPESPEDFLRGIRTFGPWADVLVINVSSPNTPGLRDLQARGILEELISAAKRERDNLPGRKPRLVLKIAPDVRQEQLEDIAAAVRSVGVDGVIVSNTTVQRPASLKSEFKSETGGLSGPPLFPLSLDMTRRLRTLLPHEIPIIGCGGISSGADAIKYAQAGASCVQVYTSFGYEGVGTARRIKDEIVSELQRLGTTWAELSEKASKELSVQGKGLKKLNEGRGAQGFTVQSLIKEAEEIKRRLEVLEDVTKLQHQS